ncbi:hypothetical protein GDO78_000685 [Eleutherodactylus coqui]|uniref:Uncharacterized protein n=1 Tax=Eleutherodactylus coqui TaxID=57060 RepID=A0A8J6FT34_ELECQ|nr:hypothetical protein GDO78_000685 [Eleutherodactylus coqui]
MDCHGSGPQGNKCHGSRASVIISFGDSPIKSPALMTGPSNSRPIVNRHIKPNPRSAACSVGAEVGDLQESPLLTSCNPTLRWPLLSM